ncbi:DNA modification methylase [Campylobacter sp. MIT 12-5580]|uniref:DNA adenine methylase n=1 Tax=Campylobacter sp. MIT 12-5580 TaxID=2040651 RepID=UPI0010FA5B14|nr:DNA adenine methylase [Campylobacter sp. MIT 12-5580]TKX29552.1 DNA modification methylase [Campylobacter sp. MIT 12-5580]
MSENKAYLKEQIITYLGNKRSLLPFLEQGFEFAKQELKKEKLSFLDIFSGSGVVSRFAKAHSSFIIANDLEHYSKIINECYLANPSQKELQSLQNYHHKLSHNLKPQKGFISELYAPKDELKIKAGERVFYTPANALYLDSMRQLISKEIPSSLQHFFIAPLIYEASVHANTSGVFKGFYKDKMGLGKFGGTGEHALKRIKGQMSLKMPVFSNFSCPFEVRQEDALSLAKELDSVDLAYFDPPYNQHPYASNYFMLNLIATYKKPNEISKVSGIPKEWNRSDFNKARLASEALFELISHTKAKIILLSYNNEGFIKKEEFLKKLAKLGKCHILEQKYPAFRASRNLKDRALHIKEHLYILVKS